MEGHRAVTDILDGFKCMHTEETANVLGTFHHLNLNIINSTVNQFIRKSINKNQ